VGSNRGSSAKQLLAQHAHFFTLLWQFDKKPDDTSGKSLRPIPKFH
jgi:hypothetical protein